MKLSLTIGTVRFVYWRPRDKRGRVGVLGALETLPPLMLITAVTFCALYSRVVVVMMIEEAAVVMVIVVLFCSLCGGRCYQSMAENTQGSNNDDS